MENESRLTPYASCKTVWCCACVLGLVAVCIASAAYRITEFRVFSLKLGRIDAVVTRWRHPSDPRIHTDDKLEYRWIQAWMAVQSAVGNVCFTPEYVPISEMNALIEDFESLDRQQIAAKTLEAAWDRLGETGPKGKAYAVQKRPLFDEHYLHLLETK